jgi:hypothetical protein
VGFPVLGLAVSGAVGNIVALSAFLQLSRLLAYWADFGRLVPLYWLFYFYELVSLFSLLFMYSWLYHLII